jgi:hypothetical protein
MANPTETLKIANAESVRKVDLNVLGQTCDSTYIGRR